MNDPGYFLFNSALPVLGIILLYFFIKVALRNGVREAATLRFIDSVREIEKTVLELKIAKREGSS